MVRSAYIAHNFNTFYQVLALNSIALPIQLNMQSPHPRQKVGFTKAGSLPSIRKMALIEQDFAALQSEHRRHFSGSMKALCIQHHLVKGFFKFNDLQNLPSSLVTPSLPILPANQPILAVFVQSNFGT
jgi:hypothetical protein